MAEETPGANENHGGDDRRQRSRLLTVVTPLWDQQGHLCGSAPICQRRSDWRQIEQTARECEAWLTSLLR